MKMTEPLVLPEDVVLVPTAELPPALRARVGGEAGDYAISRPWSRFPSKLVDADAAAVLQRFLVPTTIADAVLDYSAANGDDPETVLSEVFPLLQRLVHARFLVEAASADKGRIAAGLAPGDRLETYEILQCLQVTQDTEVYQVRTADAGLAVAKVLRPGHTESLGQHLAREAAILAHLDGDPSPTLLGEGTYDGRPYLLMAWCAGAPVSTVAAELRRLDQARADDSLIDLCRGVTDAYAMLHAKGVIHGDVHPRNILVAPDGTMKVIDLGLARFADRHRLGEPPRGGLAYYFEPEMARAYLQRSGIAASSTAGEQYGLAALFYSLFTGEWYLDFGAGTEEMYRQILDEPPVPFARRGRAPWPALEQVLSRALSKQPGDRFADLTAMAAALRDVKPPSSLRRSRADEEPGQWSARGTEESEFLARLLRRYQLDSPLLAPLGLPAPTASVSYGRAGVALGLHQIACARDDPALAALADVWVAGASVRGDDERAFLNPEYGLTPDVLGRVSSFFGAPGVHLAAAIIADARGDAEACDGAVVAFLRSAASPSATNLDLTLGNAGILHGCATLQEILIARAAGTAGDTEGAPLAPPAAIAALADDTSRAIWAAIDAMGPIGQARELTYLGVAHGWAGILYASLRWAAASRSQLPAGAVPRLQELAACGEPVGRGLRWPVQLVPGHDPRHGGYMPGWCNGSAGYVALWRLAHEVTGQGQFFDLAERAGWQAWEDGDTYPTLCCGYAGRGYALLELFQATGDRKWLGRAQSMASRAVAGLPAVPDGLRHTLYKGDLGAAVLCADIDRPEVAHFPFFEADL